MSEQRDQLMTPELRAKIEAFIASNEDGIIKLDIFLQTGKLLYSTDDVMQMTGWSRAHITKLCRKQKLSHIPGNPNRFLLAPLIQSLEDMTIGGPRQRNTTKSTRGQQKHARL